MNILSVDSSAKVASCAILNEEKLVGEIYLDCGLVHSTTLAPMVKSLLDLSNFCIKEIDLFCVSNGPGSFTGIRIGVALVKGLALSLNKMTLGVSTLHALAFNAIDQESALICPCMDARRNQLYAALFKLENSKITRITKDSAISSEDLFLNLKEHESKNKNIILVGDGADLFFNFIRKQEQFFLNNKVKVLSSGYRYQAARNVAFAALNLLAQNNVPSPAKNLQVNYLRPSQAEREKEAPSKKV